MPWLPLQPLEPWWPLESLGPQTLTWSLSPWPLESLVRLGLPRLDPGLPCPRRPFLAAPRSLSCSGPAQRITWTG